MCRLIGHRWVEITHRHDMPYMLDGREVVARAYVLEECARCDFLGEYAAIQIGGPVEHGAARLLFAMGERTVLERVEDAQVWNT